MAQLTELKEQDATRRRTGVILTAAAAAVVFAGGAWFATANIGGADDSSVATPPSPSSVSLCGEPGVTCVGDDQYRVALTVPVTVTLPPSFNDALRQFGGEVLEVYRADIGATGVSVFENAIPVLNDETWSRDPAAGTTAESVATWLSTRPFLTDTTVTPTFVGGLPAWRVSGDLRADAVLPAFKAGIGAVAPTFATSSATTAFSPDLTGEYTLVDVPGADLTVIWSWSSDASALSGNQALVDSLSFG